MNNRLFASISCLCLLSACGTEIVRTIDEIPPTFSISPGDLSLEGLQIRILDQIDDSGNHSLSISSRLKNSAGSTGQTWSNMFGESIGLSVSDLKFSMSLEKNQTDSAFLMAEQTLPTLSAPKVFGAQIELYSSDEVLVSTKVDIPTSLVDIRSPFTPLSNRLLSNCKVLASDPESDLLWLGQSSHPLRISFGAKSEYTSEILDSGWWVPTRDLFEVFYSAAALATADLIAEPTAETTTPLVIQRVSNQAARVFKTGILDRSLLVSITIEERRSTKIRYVGSCL